MQRLDIDVRMIVYSGIGTYLQNIIPRLLDHFDITLLGPRVLLEHFTWSKAAVVIDFDMPIYSVKEQMALPFKMSGETIFWSPHYNVSVLPIMKSRRVVTVHDVYHLHAFKELSLSQKIYAKRMMRCAVNFSSRIITVSDFSKSEIVRYTQADPAKIHVIDNGVDYDWLGNMDSASLAKMRQQYGLPEKFVLYVGNVKPHKNLKRLLQAFKKICRKYEDYSLVILGKITKPAVSGEDLVAEVARDADLKGRVMFLGNVSGSIAPIYRMAELFVFPSMYEGFGLPPLEAMACGCPVLVSIAASMPSVCGTAAHYFDPYNVDDMASSMDKLLEEESLRKAYVLKGKERVAQFSWDRSAMEHVKVFDELIDNVCYAGRS